MISRQIWKSVVTSEDCYDEALGPETGKAFKALLDLTWRINETWHEFSAAWFCSDADIETMNATSKFFFLNYRNGLLAQLVLDLVNITAEKQVQGAEQASLGNFVASTDALENWGADELQKIRNGMRKVSKLRNNQIAHWQKDVKTGARRKARIDFVALETAVSEVTSFMERVHNRLLPSICCRPIFEGMTSQHERGFSSIIDLVRQGLEARQNAALTNLYM